MLLSLQHRSAPARAPLWVMNVHLCEDRASFAASTELLRRAVDEMTREGDEAPCFVACGDWNAGVHVAEALWEEAGSAAASRLPPQLPTLPPTLLAHGGVPGAPTSWDPTLAEPLECIDLIFLRGVGASGPAEVLGVPGPPWDADGRVTAASDHAPVLAVIQVPSESGLKA